MLFVSGLYLFLIGFLLLCMMCYFGGSSWLTFFKMIGALAVFIITVMLIAWCLVIIGGGSIG